MAVVDASGVASGCGSGNGYQMRVAVSGCAEACGGCTVFAQIIREILFIAPKQSLLLAKRHIET
jgi:hypothetical protein